MVTPGSPSLVEVLRSTLKRLEQNEDLASDDPALAELKGTIVRAITEMEVGKTPRPTPQQRILWITPRPQPVAVEPPLIEALAEAVQPEVEESSEKTLAAAGGGKVSARKTRARGSSGRRS